MLMRRVSSLILAFLIIALCIPLVFAEDLQLNENMNRGPTLGETLFGFAKPKWTYNGDDWKLAGDQYKDGGDYENALHAYDKSLENYGLALKEKEVEWSTRDAKYNKMQSSDLMEGETKLDMIPIAKENIQYVLARKEAIYKKTGDNEKALDCLNSILADDPGNYKVLNEKVDILKKLGRTSEAAEVQKLADANKPVVQSDHGGCLIATATFGSPMAAQVQLLRDFRQNTIYSSAAGTQFMIAFETWYYSFSPTIADFINDHPLTKPPMRVILTPLLGILSLSKYMSLAFAFHTELSVIVAGLIASSLIGLVYFFPLLLIMHITARHYHRCVVNTAFVKSLLAFVVFSNLLLLCGYISSIQLFLLIGSSFFVVSILLLSAFGAVWLCDHWVYWDTKKIPAP